MGLYFAEPIFRDEERPGLIIDEEGDKKGSYLIVIKGLPGSGKLQYAKDVDWGRQYGVRNPSIINRDYQDIDFNTFYKNGHDLIVLINPEWLEDGRFYQEMIDQANYFGYTNLVEIYFESNQEQADCNVYNKWAAKDYNYYLRLKNKISSIHSGYHLSTSSQLFNGAIPVQIQYSCKK